MKKSSKKSNNSKISAVILTLNEENKIGDCLNSLDWVDEIVLVDSDSTDKTAEIAKSFGAKVYSFVKGNFSDRRNFGTSKAMGEWVLHIDADERVTKELKDEILEIVKKESDFSHFAIPRQNFVFGKKMLHCGLWPDYVVRLFRKSNFIKWEGDLHETVKVKGKLGYMNNYFVHIKHDNLFDIVEKTNKWSCIEADLMFNANHPPMNLPRFASAIFREFYLRMIKQKAFLDGVEGVIYGIYQVWSKFISYAKLWERQVNGV
ncbi:MAG: glycosyl transferase [Patescibacteria group bacterium]|jgi:glycosyltransferase involved in cell wall biosynthesis|nr:MAG: glycosyl transferase [Patescibacteria group bacterium]